ncbi:hypothetical protein, partial [Aeromonas taiwanensis]
RQGATVDQGMIVSLFPVNAIWVNSYGSTGDSDIAEDVVILSMPVIPVQPVTTTLILGEAENLVDIFPSVR